MTKRSFGAALAAGFVGGAALGAALGVGLAARRINERHPPAGRFVTAGGVRLHVLEAGAGDPVLLIHGNAVTAEDWRASGVFEALAATHRVIAPDRPGCGASARPRDRAWTAAAQAACLAELLDDGAPAVVVAHSLGVQVALRLALGWPQRVRGLVLISGYYFPTLRLDALGSAIGASVGIGDAWRWTGALPLGRLLAGPTVAGMFAPERASAGFAAQVFEPSLRPLQQRATAADGARMVPEAAALCRRLGEVSPGVVVIGGDEDRIVDFSGQSGKAARRLPHARAHRVRGAGHMAHHGRADLVAGAVAAVS